MISPLLDIASSRQSNLSSRTEVGLLSFSPSIVSSSSLLSLLALAAGHLRHAAGLRLLAAVGLRLSAGLRLRLSAAGLRLRL